MPTGGREGRRKSQEFRDICLKFGETPSQSGTKEDVRRKPGRDPSRNLNCSFASVSGISPGPNLGRGHRGNIINKHNYLLK